MRLAVAIILAASAVTANAQQLYRWTDESGRTHVTDTPPPAGAKNVQKKSGPGVAEPGKAGTPAEPYVLQQARTKYPVTFYSTPGCEACDLTRKLLNERGVPFKEHTVNDEASLAELKKSVGSNSVPSVTVGASVFKGFEESGINRLLDAAGYPKAGILPPRTQTAPVAAVPQPAEVKPVEPEPAKGPYAPKPPAEPRKGAPK